MWRLAIEFTFGTMWRMDHTFHPAKFIRVGGERVFEAFLHILNEYGQRIWFGLVPTTSLGHVATYLKDVVGRTKRHCWPDSTLPVVAVVDNPGQVPPPQPPPTHRDPPNSCTLPPPPPPPHAYTPFRLAEF